MKKYILIMVFCVFLIGCAEKPIGGEKDEHGCVLMAGYTWCESKQKCLRAWEEDCPLAPPEEKSLTPEECLDKGGRTVNIVGEDYCKAGEINIGEVKGFISPNVCCLPSDIEKLTFEKAVEIAQNTECTEKGVLTEQYMYNEHSKTWWIDLDMKEEFKKDYCNPACVVNEVTKTAEINWRCTGVLPP